MAEAIALEELDPSGVALDQIDVSRPELMRADAHWGYLSRLRKEAPVHKGVSPLFGEHWSVTKFNDSMAMERNHQAFSSDLGIALAD